MRTNLTPNSARVRDREKQEPSCQKPGISPKYSKYYGGTNDILAFCPMADGTTTTARHRAERSAGLLVIDV